MNTEDKKKEKKQKSCKIPNAEYVIGVKVHGNQSHDIEIALREFKRVVKDSGILEEYRDRQEFIKPSVINRKMRMSAIRRQQMQDFEEHDEIY